MTERIWKFSYEIAFLVLVLRCPNENKTVRCLSYLLIYNESIWFMYICCKYASLQVRECYDNMNTCEINSEDLLPTNAWGR